MLQTDIESHGRIVKLVLGLCEELSQDPGLYDLQVGTGAGRERSGYSKASGGLEAGARAVAGTGVDGSQGPHE